MNPDEVLRLLRRVAFMRRLPIPVAEFVCIHMARWYRDVHPDRDCAMSWMATHVALTLGRIP